MKSYFKLLSALIFTLLLLSLGSCESEEPVTPITVKSAENSQQAGFILQRHLLTHFGSQAIYYNEFHQVKMVVYDARYTSKYERYTANGNKFVKATLYSFGQAIREDVYTLNEKNMATKLITKHLQFGGNVAKTENHSFVYNADGKLLRFYNQAQPKEQTKFAYDNSGNLQKVEYFKANGTALKTITYYYTNDYHDSKIEDSYHFNPELSNLDFHLRIFGTFSKHLVMAELVNNHDPTLPDTNVFFKYNFNSDGYPYLREKHWSNGSALTAYYEFKKVYVGLD